MNSSQSFDFGLGILDFGFWIGDFGFWIGDATGIPPHHLDATIKMVFRRRRQSKIQNPKSKIRYSNLLIGYAGP